MDEGVSYYCPGGFHPVLIGDVLDGRFKVVNKLGFGPEATVWLCRHVRWDEWRAIKIYAAESSHENLASAKVQETLHLSPSLDHFWVVGPNGRHLCAVQRLLGPLVSEVACQFPERPLFLRDICRQMATAVSSLHKQGFYHGRLHPGNIRFVVNDAIRRLTEQEMKEMIGRPYICHDPAHPSNKYANRPPSTHIPEYLVSPTELGFPTGRLGGYDRGSYTTPFIALADLDAYTQHPPNTTNPPPPRKPIHLPTSYHPPETWATTLTPNPLTTDTDPTTLAAAADIWALAGCMYAAVCGTQAFYGESVISCVTACLGTAPGETATGWRGSGVVKEEAFDEAFVKVLGRVRAKKEEAVKGGGLEEGGSLVADVMEEVLLVRLGYVAGYEVWGWGDVEEGEEAERSEKSWLGLWQRGLDSGCKRYMEREDIRLFADLLGKMFRWRPDERASIEEVLEHPWIRDAPGWESELACRPSLPSTSPLL